MRLARPATMRQGIVCRRRQVVSAPCGFCRRPPAAHRVHTPGWPVRGCLKQNVTVHSLFKGGRFQCRIQPKSCLIAYICEEGANGYNRIAIVRELYTLIHRAHGTRSTKCFLTLYVAGRFRAWFSRRWSAFGAGYTGQWVPGPSHFTSYEVNSFPRGDLWIPRQMVSDVG